MNVLGVSFGFHDAAAAVLVDGNVVAAIQEERLTRNKHDPVFPEKAVEYCLAHSGLRISDIDAVVYHEDPILKFDRILSGAVRSGFRRGFRPAWNHVDETMRRWIRESKFNILENIANRLQISPSKVFNVRHHEAHVASAFFCSPFDQATVISIDGVGEYESASVWRGEGKTLTKLHSINFPHSLGLLYSAVMAFLGFEVNEGEYKVMGLAGYGSPSYLEEFREVFSFTNGGFKLNDQLVDFFMPVPNPITDKFERLFGKPRTPGTPFRTGRTQGQTNDQSLESESCRYADIAASLQRLTEDAILHLVRHWVSKTGVNNVAMAGGVALNGLANGRISRELGVDLYVQPASGDAGGALGAALFHAVRHSGIERPAPLTSVFLGGRYDTAEFEKLLKSHRIESFRRFENRSEMLDKVAEYLADGKVVGWFQGRSEWGPRALGARSILANPADPGMKEKINEKIKFRELFRPFAPAVLVENATEFFDIPEPKSRLQPETFMQAVAHVRPEAVARIPAAVHVDGTARLQLVWNDKNMPLREILEAFNRVQGLPVLINTSFNRKGEPIVETPEDALKTFMWSGLDYLVVDDLVVSKDRIQ